jgi:hypothetical protein
VVVVSARPVDGGVRVVEQDRLWLARSPELGILVGCDVKVCHVI